MNPSVDKTVKSGLRGNSSYESGMTPWMRFTVIGELDLHNSGKEQVILRLPYLRKHCHHVLCHNYFDMVFLSRFFIFIDSHSGQGAFFGRWKVFNLDGKYLIIRVALTRMDSDT